MVSSVTSGPRLPFTPEFQAKYQIVRLLGEGGSALVYLAMQRSLQRMVAVKFLTNHLFREEESLQRFLDEAKITAGLQHGNIVQIYDFGVMGDLPFAVYEYVEGKQLRDRLQKGRRVTPLEALRISQEVLAGLGHAHAGGVIHRDLKPENILIDTRGTVKIADFGLAKSHQARDYKTRAGVVLGTPEYISPEQATGEAATPSSDLYAVGIMLYELLTGRTPFEGKNDLAILMGHVQTAPPPFSEVAPDLPEVLWTLVERALGKKPEQRYPNAEAFSAAIEEAMPYAERASRVVPSGVIRTLRGTAATENVSDEALASAKRLIWVGGSVLLVALLSAAAYIGLSVREGGFSVEKLEVRPGVRTARVTWVTSTPTRGVLQFQDEKKSREEGDWAEAEEEADSPSYEHALNLAGLTGDTAYRIRVVFPNGRTSLPRRFQTVQDLTLANQTTRYLSRDRVSVEVTSSLPLSAELALPAPARLLESSSEGTLHRFVVEGFEPLAGLVGAHLAGSLPSGERVEAALAPVPSLPELLREEIEKLDLATLIRDLSEQLNTRKSIADRVAVFDELRSEPFFNVFKLFRADARRYFQDGSAPLGGRLSTYHSLIELEALDSLADLYKSPAPLGISEVVEPFVKRKYLSSPLSNPTTVASLYHPKGNNAFYPYNFDSTEYAAFRESLAIVQGMGRKEDVLILDLPEAPPGDDWATAAVMVANLPPRYFLEARLNGELSLVFRNTQSTYTGMMGAPPVQIWNRFPASLLKKGRNRLVMKMYSLPGLMPIHNCSLYRIWVELES